MKSAGSNAKRNNKRDTAVDRVRIRRGTDLGTDNAVIANGDTRHFMPLRGAFMESDKDCKLTEFTNNAALTRNFARRK